MSRDEIAARLKKVPPRSELAIRLQALLLAATNAELAAKPTYRIPAVSVRQTDPTQEQANV